MAQIDLVHIPYSAGTWFGVLAPAGTPREIVGRLNGEIGKVLAEVDARL